MSETGTLNSAEKREPAPSPAPNPNLVAEKPIEFSPLRKHLLLVFFCLAQFLDIFNLSALFPAIPRIAHDLNMTGSEAVWIVSALQLTFASFLLISGRISDIYNAKWTFILGLAGVGLIDLGLGFMRNMIGFFVLRAIGGIFSALTIPSALHLIVGLFPEATEQAKAIAIFGACGGLANSIGVIIGASLVEKASWHWIFYVVTIAALITSIASIPLIPPRSQMHAHAGNKKGYEKLKQLDLIGVAILTCALVLLVFSLTQGSNTKWAKVGVLLPLVIAVIMIIGFFFYETLLPEEMVSVPPSTWFLPNFAVLFGTSLLPYFWWTSIFLVYIQYWQDVFGWSALNAAVHILPAATMGLFMAPTGPLQDKISPKWIILFGMTMVFIGTTILPFAGGRHQYWDRVFPAFVVGSAGMMIVYVHVNIAIFRTTPARMAGVVGALFNSALQVGSAVGVAIVTSIATSIQNKDGADGFTSFHGRASAYWFVFAMVCVVIVAVAVFYHPERAKEVQRLDAERGEKPSVAAAM